MTASWADVQLLRTRELHYPESRGADFNCYNKEQKATLAHPKKTNVSNQPPSADQPASLLHLVHQPRYKTTEAVPPSWIEPLAAHSPPQLTQPKAALWTGAHVHGEDGRMSGHRVSECQPPWLVGYSAVQPSCLLDNLLGRGQFWGRFWRLLGNFRGSEWDVCPILHNCSLLPLWRNRLHSQSFPDMKFAVLFTTNAGNRNTGGSRGGYQRPKSSEGLLQFQAFCPWCC